VRCGASSNERPRCSSSRTRRRAVSGPGLGRDGGAGGSGPDPGTRLRRRPRADRPMAQPSAMKGRTAGLLRLLDADEPELGPGLDVGLDLQAIHLLTLGSWVEASSKERAGRRRHERPSRALTPRDFPVAVTARAAGFRTRWLEVGRCSAPEGPNRGDGSRGPAPSRPAPVRSRRRRRRPMAPSASAASHTRVSRDSGAAPRACVTAIRDA